MLRDSPIDHIPRIVDTGERVDAGKNEEHAARPPGGSIDITWHESQGSRQGMLRVRKNHTEEGEDIRKERSPRDWKRNQEGEGPIGKGGWRRRRRK